MDEDRSSESWSIMMLALPFSCQTFKLAYWCGYKYRIYTALNSANDGKFFFFFWAGPRTVHHRKSMKVFFAGIFKAFQKKKMSFRFLCSPVKTNIAIGKIMSTDTRQMLWEEQSACNTCRRLRSGCTYIPAAVQYSRTLSAVAFPIAAAALLARYYFLYLFSPRRNKPQKFPGCRV